MNHYLQKSLTKSFKVRKGMGNVFVKAKSQLFDSLKIKNFCASRTYSNYIIKSRIRKKNYKQNKRQIFNIFTI